MSSGPLSERTASRVRELDRRGLQAALATPELLALPRPEMMRRVTDHVAQAVRRLGFDYNNIGVEQMVGCGLTYDAARHIKEFLADHPDMHTDAETLVHEMFLPRSYLLGTTPSDDGEDSE